MWKRGFALALIPLAVMVLAKEEPCKCVPYYQCLGSISVGGGGIFSRGQCEDALDVCCKPATPEIPSAPATPLVTRKGGCGRRNPYGVGFRAARGTDNEARIGEFPWVVAVLRADPPEGEEESLNAYLCGGSLIHPKVVLTGAHCVAEKKNHQVKIRAGDWDTRSKIGERNFQERLVNRIVVHEDFNGGNLFNDVALLFLSKPVDRSDNVGFACVPSQGYVTTPGTRCLATVWGKDDNDGESQTASSQPTLKKIELPVVAHPECQTALRKTILGRHFKLHESFMCAGGEQGKDTCKGDGGSPLVCPHPDNPSIYVQSGIVAWGIGCREHQVPGVYANVALFRNWIDGHIHNAQLDTSHYSY